MKKYLWMSSTAVMIGALRVKPDFEKQGRADAKPFVRVGVLVHVRV